MVEEVVETPTQENVESPETVEQTTVQETKTEEVKEIQEPETKEVTEKETAEVKAEIDPDEISKDADGNFVFQVDSSDPKSSIYKGKTRKELFEHIAKGVKDKDVYIKDLKARQLNEEVNRKPDEDEKVIVPDYSRTLGSILNELNIDKSVLTWNDEKWREREAEFGAVATMKLMNLVEGAQAMAREQVDKDSVHFQNDINLKGEIEQVIEDVKEAGVDFTRDDLREVLNSIEKDKTSYRDNGIRKQGLITRKCMAKIRELAKQKAVDEIVKKKSEESAINREKKADVTTVGKSKTKTEIKTASAKDINEATENIKRKWANELK
jgi:hypothetical protein